MSKLFFYGSANSCFLANFHYIHGIFYGEVSMRMRTLMQRTSLASLIFIPLTFITATFTTASLNAAIIDFEGLANGQKIDMPFEVSPLVNVTSSGNNQGAAIFDSDPNGPNMISGDMDLLVNSGNLLILQDNDHPLFTGDIFDTPDDANTGGEIVFTFADPSFLMSMDLVDVDIAGAIQITMIDGGGLQRTYSVPEEWTGDGVLATLDLTTLSGQAGPGPSGPATAMEDNGFNSQDVRSMVVTLDGSGGLDNLTFVPEPTALFLLLVGISLLRRCC